MTKKRAQPVVRKGNGTDWAAAELEFVNGSTSLADHATAYNVTPDAMRQRAARGKWMSKRQALSREVTARAQAELTAAKVNELAEFNAADVRMSRALRGVAAKMLADSMRPDGKKLTAAEARTIASLAESAQKIGRIALDAATENIGHGGTPGAPPITTGSAPPEAVAKAMNEYLHPF